MKYTINQQDYDRLYSLRMINEFIALNEPRFDKRFIEQEATIAL